MERHTSFPLLIIVNTLIMTVLDILFWVSVFTGGLMFVMLLLSVIGGLDFDLDLDVGGDTETEGGGGLGVLKSILTFVSVSSWVMRIMLIYEQSSTVSITVGVVVGVVIVYLLSKLLVFLMSQTEFNSYDIEDSIERTGKVYLKLPVDGHGIVQVVINDGVKDFKGKSYNNKEIPTGTEVIIVDVLDNYVIVEPIS